MHGVGEVHIKISSMHFDRPGHKESILCTLTSASFSQTIYMGPSNPDWLPDQFIHTHSVVYTYPGN